MQVIFGKDEERRSASPASEGEEEEEGVEETDSRPSSPAHDAPVELCTSTADVDAQLAEHPMCMVSREWNRDRTGYNGGKGVEIDGQPIIGWTLTLVVIVKCSL